MAESGRNRWLLLLPALLTMILILMIILHVQFGEEWLSFLIDEDTHHGIFLLTMAVFPMCGFPISPFLVLIGIKFTLYPAIVLTGLIFAVQLWLSYLLAHSVMRPVIHKILTKAGYRMPRIHQQNQVAFAVVFMAIPGLPYTVKNYFLASLNIPFRIYFPAGWGCNVLLALPLIGLGHTLLENPRLAIGLLVLVVFGYGLSVWLKRKLTTAR